MKNGAPVDKGRNQRITDLIAHRAPDDSVFYFGNGIAFGHRRLSIIDLSARGHQSMCYRDRYSITHNGEIYNYLEIRQDLEQIGVALQMATDTEVMLAADAAWCTACLIQELQWLDELRFTQCRR